MARGDLPYALWENLEKIARAGGRLLAEQFEGELVAETDFVEILQ